jgi:phospholipid-binding lipoprotein MlaA
MISLSIFYKHRREPMTKFIILIVGVIGIFSFFTQAFSDDSLPSDKLSQEKELIQAQDKLAQKPDESIEKSDQEMNPSDQEKPPEEEEAPQIADPLFTWNKGMYYFNDKFYFWLLKPVSQGYSAVVPEGMRVSISNFYENISTPVRFINNLLQLKFKSAGNELVRLFANTTFGVGGLGDFAKDKMDIKWHDEDFGQTFAHYGIGQGIYNVWPFLGSSSLRDSIGFVGDRFLHPLSYVGASEISLGAATGIYAHEEVNDITFHIGEYEDLKKAAIDPYISIRDAYVQHRKKDVEE